MQVSSKTKPKPIFQIGGSETSSMNDLRNFMNDEEMDILSPLPVDGAQYFTVRSAGSSKNSPKFKFPMSAPALDRTRLDKLRFNFDFDCSHTVDDNVFEDVSKRCKI